MIWIEIPPKAERILRVLQENGFEAYVVGGCVRDSLRGRKPHDWDITTSAAPEQVKQLFGRTIDTGIRHGTVTVMDDKDGFEVTTYRIDGIYEDGRHPKQVTFTASLKEDLMRRDFTINAMAYSPESGIVDLFGGLDDLREGRIRCVGDPKERFGEDALRMLRAVRFAAQLGFSVTEDVLAAIRELSGTLRRVSAERIQAELIKLLISSRPDYLRLAYECGITAVVMPEFDRIMEQRQNNPHHAYTAGEHTLAAMKNIPADRVLRLTMLFHDMGKPQVFETDEKGIDHFHGHAAYSEIIARQIMRRLKLDNKTINAVCTLVGNHSRYPKLTAFDVRKTAYEIGGSDVFEQFLLVKRADVLAQHPDVIAQKMDYLKALEHIWQDIKLHQDPLSLKELAVSGDDLIADGWKPGPGMGEILQALFMEVLEFPERNRKEYLLKRSREL
ncbi:MAG: CCA tRNA nucleotidyltransferase [Lachnospiraceae bacterium]|nr:CCA tRNA nucleotidyltransferase [Lachnospiraceae bacterium]